MPSAELSFIGISRFRGYWNASTNTALSGGVLFSGSHVSGAYGNGVLAGSDVLSVGEYWQVNTAGSTNLDGTSSWQVSDWVVYTSGSSWTKVDYNETLSTIVVGSTDITTLAADLLVSSSNTQVLFNSGSQMSGSKNLTYDYTSGIVRLTGSLFVSGTLVANEFKINVVNESVVNISSTGSTDFGNSADDIHKFTGNVGIGTASPAKHLHINGSSGEVELRLQSSNKYSSIVQTDNAQLLIQNASAGDILFYDDGAEIFRLDASADSLLMAGTKKIEFNDASQFVHGSDANTLSLGATAEIDLTATSIDINGVTNISPSLTVGGSVQVTGSLSVSGSATIVGGEAQAATLTLSADQGDDAADTTTLSVADGGNFTVDCAADIALNADGGNVEIYDDSALHFAFDCDSTKFTIYDDQDAGDLFKIQVAQHGATTIATVDDDADNADLFFDVDGDIELDADTGLVTIRDDGASAFDFEATSGSFKIWTRPLPGAASGIAANHSAYATLAVAGSGSTTLATFDSQGTSANLIFDADGDIELNADGGQVTIKDDSASHFLFDCDATALTIYDDTAVADYFKITVAANGATTLATNDNDGTAGSLTLDADGDIQLNADGGNVEIYDDSALHFAFDCDNTKFTIYDDQDTGDLFKIQVAQHGATTITTVDDDADNADLHFDVDGDIELDADAGRVAISDNGRQSAVFDATSGSFKLVAIPSVARPNPQDYALLTVSASGSTTLSTYDDVGANGHLTLDADGDIVLDAAGDNIDIKKAGSPALSINLITTGSGPTVDFRQANTSNYAAISFSNFEGHINAMSIDNGTYGGWVYKKAIHTVSGSDVNLSALSMSGAMAYCGSVLKAIAVNAAGATTTITLPTATTPAQAQQLLGYNFRVMLDTPAVGTIKVARGDATNDFMFGYIVDAGSSATPAGIIFSGTGPGAAGHDYAAFVGGTAVTGDYVDVVCVSATDSLMKWLVTGVAST